MQIKLFIKLTNIRSQLILCSIFKITLRFIGEL